MENQQSATKPTGRTTANVSSLMDSAKSINSITPKSSITLNSSMTNSGRWIDVSSYGKAELDFMVL